MSHLTYDHLKLLANLYEKNVSDKNSHNIKADVYNNHFFYS